jgi:hypothetical protein
VGNVTACWFPLWYNLDQELAVGETAEWGFWVDRESLMEWLPRDQHVPNATLYFCGVEGPSHDRRCTVAAITHGSLGSLTRASTDRFGVYEFELADGTVLEVEAEEGPGQCDDRSVTVHDWSLLVTLTDVSEPLRNSQSEPPT